MLFGVPNCLCTMERKALWTTNWKILRLLGKGTHMSILIGYCYTMFTQIAISLCFLFCLCSLLARPNNEQSLDTASKISTASKFSAHEDFVDKFPYRNINELLDLQNVCKSVNNHCYIYILYYLYCHITMLMVIFLHVLLW